MRPLARLYTLERRRVTPLKPPPPLSQERLKAGEHRPEMDDKADKRTADPKPRPSSLSSPSPSPIPHHHRKPPPLSRSPTPSTSSLGPLPSPVAALKSEEGGQQRASSHPPAPPPHPPSPRSASPPSFSPRRPKLEAGRREQREGQKATSATFQGSYSGESGGIERPDVELLGRHERLAMFPGCSSALGSSGFRPCRVFVRRVSDGFMILILDSSIRDS